MSETVKERIGNYELLELIGDGAQGKIFKARCLAENTAGVAVGELVAIKVLRIAADDAKARARFKSQAEILKSLSHPNIVRYRDCFIWHPEEWDEAHCLVMEFLDGETFAARLKSAPKGLPWPEIKAVFEPCLAGLSYARAQGIIHRDLKPSNIFITKANAVRIFDFDIARHENESLMSTAGWKGTFDYMAPDFVMAADFRGDEISDVFSLGVCIYQALTGQLPFEPLGTDAHIGYMNRWKDGAAWPEISFRAGVFRVLANAKLFISRSLNPRRDQRYQSFAEMLADLQQIHYRTVCHEGQDVYELHAVLGRGGFGEVFKGIRRSDGRPLAIKHLFTEKQSDRFIKEARILQSYSHPHTVQYIDFVAVQGATRENQYFLVLELLDGMPEAGLRARIRREGKLALAEAVPLFINYLEALAFLHENSRPIIHRDIKPNNLYAPPGQPEQAKIFDLGVARDVSGTVTTGGVPGTLDYMAPEFARAGAERGSPQSDIYALGLCFYEAITGQPAFEKLPTDINSAWLEFQRRTQHPEVKFDDDLFTRFPQLGAILRKALAPNPRNRYRRAADMQEELKTFLEENTQAQGMDLSGAGGDLRTLATVNSGFQGAQPPAAPAQRRITPPPEQPAFEPPEDNLPDLDLPEPGHTQATRMADAAYIKWAAHTLNLRRLAAIAAGVIAVALTLWLAVWFVNKPSGAEMTDSDLAALTATLGKPFPPGIPDAESLRALNLDWNKARLLKEKYTKNKRLLRRMAEMEGYGQSLPQTFKKLFEEAVGLKNEAEADRILAHWSATDKYLPLMGLTPDAFARQTVEMKNRLGLFEFDKRIQYLNSCVPRSLPGEAGAMNKAEDVAIECRILRNQEWRDIGAEEQQRRLNEIGAVETALAGRIQAYVNDLTSRVTQKTSAGFNREPEWTTLLQLDTQAPQLIALIRADYDKTVAAMKTPARPKTKESAPAPVSTPTPAPEIPPFPKEIEAAGSAAELADVANRFEQWQQNPTAKLSDEKAREIENAIGDKYATLVKKEYERVYEAYDALKLTDGDQRQQSLEGLVAAVPERYGRNNLLPLLTKANNLRQQAEARSAAQRQQPQKLEAEKAAAKPPVPAPAAEQKPEIPPLAPPKITGVSTAAVAAIIPAKTEPASTATTATVAAPSKTEQPVKPEPAPAISKTMPKPVEPAQEKEPPAGEPPPVAREPGTLEIAATPTGAAIYVDDKLIGSNTVVIADDINHKIRVEMAGYKTYEQYYRVRAGEKKTIDVLLEKNKERKSFFGF